MNPILSIAVVNFNYGRYLEDAIRSVFDQIPEAGFEVGGLKFDVELVVVDGGSTDNSVDVIKKYAKELPPGIHAKDFLATSNAKHQTSNLTFWLSEKDRGQSDAFNKAFAHCRGKYLTWLNADDIMPKGCLAKIVKELAAHPDCEWFTGNMFRFCEVSELVGDGVSGLEDEGHPINAITHKPNNRFNIVEAPWGPNCLPSFLQGKGMPIAVYGPATIFTKRIFDAAGGMKLHQNFMMDTDLWMRFVMMGVRQRRINTFCWAFRMHVDSKTAEFGDHKLSPEQRAKFEVERKASMEATGYKPNALNRRLIQLWRIFDGSILKAWWLKRRLKSYCGY